MHQDDVAGEPSGFTKVVRRSIHLTPFGDDFCRAVLVSADDATSYAHHELPADPVE